MHPYNVLYPIYSPSTILRYTVSNHSSSFDLELLFPAMLRGEDTRLVVVTRAEFEAKCMPLAEQCMQKVRDIVKRARLRNGKGAKKCEKMGYLKKSIFIEELFRNPTEK